MKSVLKKQSVLFTLDQVVDSGMVFLFIALGGIILSKIDMATVVLAQSTALVCVLFCSCFTTQYLLLKYKKQSKIFWVVVFGFFYIVTLFFMSFFSESWQVILLFTAGITSEFLKRFCYYCELSFISVCSTITSVFIFFICIGFAFFGHVLLNAIFYIYCYVVARVIPLIGVFLLIGINKNAIQCKVDKVKIFEGIIESFRCGAMFSVITIIYWITNQGFFVLLQNKIPASELVEIRVTQNIFGIVTMLIALYDSIFLKKNIDNNNKIFNKSVYLKFVSAASILVVMNYIFLYFLSLTLYHNIDILKYSCYLAIAQWFFLLSRMPILILKLRYNLNVILMVYVLSLVVSSAYLLASENSSTYFYVVKAIACANFLTFIFSSLIVIAKEKNYGEVG